MVYRMNKNHFRSHFTPFQINAQLNFLFNFFQKKIWMNENQFQSLFGFFFTKWLQVNKNGCILDYRKSLSIAFLAISDQYAIFFSQNGNMQQFFFLNGRRRPFWKSDLGHFGWPKITFHKMAIRKYYYYYFFNMVVGGHFGWAKITFNCISRHFRSIRFFLHTMTAGGHFGWPKITFDRISRHFRIIRNFFLNNFFHKMAAGGHFGWPKITFDGISRHFRSMHNFLFFLQNGCRRPFWMTENHFRSHFSLFQINTQLLFFLIFFHKNGCWRPFWMTENHFWSYFSPFQINTQLLFFSQNGCRRPFWMTENHFRSHFSPFQINTQLFFSSQNGCRLPFWMTEKSLLIALLAISDQNATFLFFKFF